MAIDTGKILGISDKDYFDLTDNKSPNYLHADVTIKVDTLTLAKETFAETISHLAEVVVKYREEPQGSRYVQISGTALIPKSNLEEQLREKHQFLFSSYKNINTSVTSEGEKK